MQVYLVSMTVHLEDTQIPTLVSRGCAPSRRVSRRFHYDAGFEGLVYTAASRILSGNNKLITARDLLQDTKKQVEARRNS